MHHEEIILSCIIELNLKTIYSLEENILHLYRLFPLLLCRTLFMLWHEHLDSLVLKSEQFYICKKILWKKMFLMDLVF